MYLRTARDERRQQRGAGAAAQIAREVGEAGDLVRLGRRHAHVVQRADRDEDERQRDHLQHAPLGRAGEAGGQVEAGEVVDADRRPNIGKAHHQSRIDLAHQSP